MMPRLTWKLVALAALWASAVFLAGCRQDDSRLLEPRAALELMERNRGNAGFVLLDVRTPGEFRQGYIEGAVPLDYHAPDFRERFAALDRKATILTYCRSGNRSAGVLALADELGFERVFDLRGGILAWQSEGLPLTNGGTEPKTDPASPAQ